MQRVKNSGVSRKKSWHFLWAMRTCVWTLSADLKVTLHNKHGHLGNDGTDVFGTMVLGMVASCCLRSRRTWSQSISWCLSKNQAGGPSSRYVTCDEDGDSRIAPTAKTARNKRNVQFWKKKKSRVCWQKEKVGDNFYIYVSFCHVLVLLWGKFATTVCNLFFLNNTGVKTRF